MKQAYWFPKTPPGELQGDINDGPEAIQMVVVEVEGTGQPQQPGSSHRQPTQQQLAASHAQAASLLAAHHHHHHHPPAPVGGY